MRATSLPTALPVATAAMALMAAVLVPPAVPSAAQAERWLRPVPGDVARPFSYSRAAPFTAGAHRGVDLAAPPGRRVRAACGGIVVHAGPVAGRGAVVSIRCGRRRVSHLPLASVAVRAGTAIAAGTPIGTVAPGHGGLHVGVRREGDPFAYEDPIPLLTRHRPARPPFAAVPSRRVRVRPPAPPRPRGPSRSVPRRAQPRDARARSPIPSVPPAPVAATDRRPAPWPVFAGLALLLAGAAGSGTAAIRRRRRGAALTLSPAEPAR